MKKRLSSGKWLILFVLSVILICILWAAFNYVTDPFGVFGDRVIKWWSYDETNNPRTAKFSYLKEHHDEYDSYVVGCSSTSSYPTSELNEYFDASFYNLIMYGADLYDVEGLCRYLVENYTVKNLVVNIYVDNGISYDSVSNYLTHSMPIEISGDSPFEYYGRFLFANPSYGVEKIKDKITDTYLQKPFDVFNEKTGAYDKSVRDIEHIGDMGSYLEAYPVFADYPKYDLTITETENCVKSLTAIRELCRENGVNLVVVSAPVYYDYLTAFEKDELCDFYSALAEVIPIWDFTSSSISREPRYFYDSTHFRNAVGKMALARIFDDDGVYIPDDFGFLATAENARGHFSTLFDVDEPDVTEYTKDVPILMYHHLAETSENPEIITPESFEAQMKALRDAGYTAVDFDELYAYTTTDATLPEKPVVITFDDGYSSNLDFAYPILVKYGMKATVFVIGVSVGKDTYKDTGVAMTPHFSLDEALAAEKSGVIRIESHGFDLHEVEGRDESPIREGALQRSGESESEYIGFLRADAASENELFAGTLGHKMTALAYPYGKFTPLSEVILNEEGIRATVTVTSGMNTVVKGLPQSLRAMNRFTVYNETTPDELIKMIKG